MARVAFIQAPLPSRYALIRALLSDLIADIRYSTRIIDRNVIALAPQENERYRDLCLTQLRALFKHRHTVRLNRYGWPLLPEFNSVNHRRA